MDEGFSTFDHTGDLGLEVRARSKQRLFALAAIGLMAQIAEAGDDGSADAAELAVESDDEAMLLVDWLNAVLLEFERRRLVWTRAECAFPAAAALRGRLAGVPLDPARMTLLREVKAVSHHAVELRLEPGDCRCRVVLDI